MRFAYQIYFYPVHILVLSVATLDGIQSVCLFDFRGSLVVFQGSVLAPACFVAVFFVSFGTCECT